jgi:hypothetical protein
MKKQQFGLLSGLFAFVLLFAAQTSAQSIWLDQSPLPNWSSRSRANLETKKIDAAELARCRESVRQPTLAADRLRARASGTIVGAGRASLSNRRRNAAHRSLRRQRHDAPDARRALRRLKVKSSSFSLPSLRCRQAKA